MGAFNNYVDKMRGEGVKKWQNSVHVVVECPPIMNLNCPKMSKIAGRDE